jgi:phage shock protein PspC (stress-responsive transcriptional regulator)
MIETKREDPTAPGPWARLAATGERPPAEPPEPPANEPPGGGGGGEPPGGGGGEEPPGGGAEPPGDEPPTEPLGEGGAPSPKRLTRTRDDRVIAGVAGGLGRYFDVDPMIFRIGFAVAAFFGGAGVLAYLAAVLFVPEEGGAAEGGRPSGRVIAGVAAVLVLLLAFQVPFFGPWWIFDPGAWIGLTFIGALGVGAFLLVRGLMGRGTVTPLRVLAYFVLGSLAFAAGLCLAFLSAWAGAEGLGEIVAAVVLALGVVLVVASFTGATWARWLVVPALVMAAPLGAVAAADLEFEGGYGERYHRPASVAAIPADGYELAAGELHVDLRDLDWQPGRVVDVELDLGAGEAVVLVPEDVCVETDAHVAAGEIDVRGNEAAGVDVDHDVRPPSTAAPRLRLESDIAFGELRVEDDVFGDHSDDDEEVAAADACEAA